uniref:Zinc finger protein SNAI3 n=1 Tax=Myotis lucifugus TaxID=59463 RepID=G1Q4J5_MYOLU
MPRSFLVKTHSSHRVPNYGELETQRVHQLLGAKTSWETACSLCSAPPPLPSQSGPEIHFNTFQLWGDAGCNSHLLTNLFTVGAHHSGSRVGHAGPQTQEQQAEGVEEESEDRLLGAEQAPCAPGGFQCIHCHKLYHTLAGLARHRQLHCHLQAQRCFTCKYCDKEYSSLGALKMHIRTHTLPCICAICGKAFSRPWLLQGHIRTHTGEKPYACSHCSRAFADRSNLRAHLQTHSDTKKYQCKSCAKTFSRMSLLVRHEESGCCPGP